MAARNAGILGVEVVVVSEFDAEGDRAVESRPIVGLPEPIAPEDMTTSSAADPPPPLPDSDYDRQERFLRDAGG